MNTLTKFSKNKKFQRNSFSYEDIENFNFEFGLVSKDDDKNYFINFAPNENDMAYNIVENHYIDYLNKDYSFLNDYVMDEDGITPGDRADRLFKIINNVVKIKYTNTDCPFILKMKNMNNKELHLYFSHHKNNLKLILVDLYHLGIYGERYIDGKSKPISIQRLYKHHKGNTIDLDRIKTLK